MNTLKYITLLVLLLTLPLFGTIPNTSVWEVRPGVGSDTNGGGFDSTGTGTDMSQFNNKNAAACTNCQSATINISTTDAVAVGTTTITSATGNFSTALTGNLVFFTGGTGSIASQWRRATFVSSTSFTIDASIAASTGMTMNIGGALNSLTQLSTNLQLVGGQQAYVKATGTISTSSALSVTTQNGATNQLTTVAGYTTTRTDGGQVTIQATGGNITLFTWSSGANSGARIANFIINCNSQTNISGFNFSGAFISAENILVENCTNSFGFQFNNVDQICIRCYVTGQTAGSPFLFTANRSQFCTFCVGYSNTTTSSIFNFGSAEGACTVCIAANNSNATADGFLFANSSGSMILQWGVGYKNGRDGLRTALGTTASYVRNSVFWGNTGFAINCSGCSTAQLGGNMDYNAYVSGGLNNIPAGAHDQTLTVDPFVNGTSNNFSPNNTAGGGALLRGNGFPGVLLTGGTGFATIGALAAALGGGAVGFPIIQ